MAADDQPEGLVAPSQGNAQTTADGDLFVGWGALPYFWSSIPLAVSSSTPRSRPGSTPIARICCRGTPTALRTGAEAGPPGTAGMRAARHAGLTDPRRRPVQEAHGPPAAVAPPRRAARRLPKARERPLPRYCLGPERPFPPGPAGSGRLRRAARHRASVAVVLAVGHRCAYENERIQRPAESGRRGSGCGGAPQRVRKLRQTLPRRL